MLAGIYDFAWDNAPNYPALLTAITSTIFHHLLSQPTYNA